MSNSYPYEYGKISGFCTPATIYFSPDNANSYLLNMTSYRRQIRTTKVDPQILKSKNYF